MAILKIKNKEFPFEATPGLKKYVKEAYVNLEHVKKGAKNESKRLAYLAVKASCEAKKVEFAYSFEEFMNFVESEVVAKAKRLVAEIEKPKRIKPKDAKSVTTKTKQKDAAANAGSNKKEASTAPDK